MRTNYGELELAAPGSAPVWALRVDLTGFRVQWSGMEAPAPPVVAGDAGGWAVGAVRVDINGVAVDVVPEVTGPRQVTPAHLSAALRDPHYRAQLRSWLGC